MTNDEGGIAFTSPLGVVFTCFRCDADARIYCGPDKYLCKACWDKEMRELIEQLAEEIQDNSDERSGAWD